MRIQDVGYVISPTQQRPTHEPAHDSPCPFCGQAVTPGTIRCICLTPLEGSGVAQIFYYCHRACHDTASPEAQERVGTEAISLFESRGPRATPTTSNEPESK